MINKGILFITFLLLFLSCEKDKFESEISSIEDNPPQYSFERNHELSLISQWFSNEDIKSNIEKNNPIEFQNLIGFKSINGNLFFEYDITLEDIDLPIFFRNNYSTEQIRFGYRKLLKINSEGKIQIFFLMLTSYGVENNSISGTTINNISDSFIGDILVFEADGELFQINSFLEDGSHQVYLVEEGGSNGSLDDCIELNYTTITTQQQVVHTVTDWWQITTTAEGTTFEQLSTTHTHSLVSSGFPTFIYETYIHCPGNLGGGTFIPFGDDIYDPLLENHWRCMDRVRQILSTGIIDPCSPNTIPVNLIRNLLGGTFGDCASVEHLENSLLSDDLILPQQSFVNNEKLNCIYRNSIHNVGNSDIMCNLFNNFEGSTPMNLYLFSQDFGPSSANANTQPLSGGIGISFSQDYVEEACPIEIMSTFIHESLHADILRRLNAGISSLTPEMLSYFNNPEFESNWQHEYMAGEMVDELIFSIREMFPGYSIQEYRAIVWRGLKNTDGFESSGLDIESDINSVIYQLRQICDMSCEL